MTDFETLSLIAMVRNVLEYLRRPERTAAADALIAAGGKPLKPAAALSAREVNPAEGEFAEIAIICASEGGPATHRCCDAGLWIPADRAVSAK